MRGQIYCFVEHHASLEESIKSTRAGVQLSMKSRCTSHISPCLAYGRRCVPWLQKSHVLELFESSQAELRKAIQLYTELLEDLKHGVLLGGAGFVERMRTTIDGDTVKEQPQKRKLLQTKPVAELVRRYFSRRSVGLQTTIEATQPSDA